MLRRLWGEAGTVADGWVSERVLLPVDAAAYVRAAETSDLF